MTQHSEFLINQRDIDGVEQPNKNESDDFMMAFYNKRAERANVGVSLKQKEL